MASSTLDTQPELQARIIFFFSLDTNESQNVGQMFVNVWGKRYSIFVSFSRSIWVRHHFLELPFPLFLKVVIVFVYGSFYHEIFPFDKMKEFQNWKLRELNKIVIILSFSWHLKSLKKKARKKNRKKIPEANVEHCVDDVESNILK